MRRFLPRLLVISVFLLFALSGQAYGIENPLSYPNNKVGIHILFPEEINKAAKLINQEGDWGYVVIPIQTGDRNLEKWQTFMNSAKQNHVIPVIRVATEGNYFNTAVWKKPTYDDVLDFANFLNSLDWPVKNRYIIAFNEVNRGDEWEGSPKPDEYAEILNYTVEIFKHLNEDFFIISAGLDNGASDIPGKAFDQYDYMIQMNNAVPGIFGKIDGLGSHSYPNPGFATPPWIQTNKSISSFKFERKLALELSGKKLPVFITETGWSSKKASADMISMYFMYAFKYIWSDDGIIAVAPFLLQAGQGPFFEFSLLDENGNYNEISKSISAFQKIKGEPTINQETSSITKNNSSIQFKTFPKNLQHEELSSEKAMVIMVFLEWILKLIY